MGKSTGTNTVTQQTGPPPDVLAKYNQVYNQAQNVAGQPAPVYNGPLVAGFSPMQTAAFNNINTAVNTSQPFLNAASAAAGNATTMLDPEHFGSTVASYQSPYTQQVVDSTRALFNEQNAEQQNQVKGNAISAGAFGGDRQAVAQAETARQQQLAQAPVLAGLYNTGFQNATSAAQANAWLNSQGAFALGNLGQEAQTLGLQGANAQLTAGAQQQGLAQQELNVPYQQWLAAQGYPYQITNFLGGLAEGTGSLSGSMGSTTSPGPSALSQGAGLGLAGLGLYNSGALSGLGGIGTGIDNLTNGFAFDGMASGAGLAALDNVGGMSAADALAGGLIPVKRGGRIVGLASGGGAFPGAPPPVGLGVPDASINLIPGILAPRPPVMMQNAGATSTTDGGGGGGAGAIGDIAAAAEIAMMFLARGGAIDSALPHPGGDPGAAHLPRAQEYQDPGLVGSLGGLGAIAAARAPHRAPPVNARMGYDIGGEVPAPLMAGMGGNPMAADLYRQYATMPTEKLQEAAARVPAGSPQGRVVQMALRQRHSAPGSDPGSVPQPVSGVGPVQGFAVGGAPDIDLGAAGYSWHDDEPVPGDGAASSFGDPADYIPPVPQPQDIPALRPSGLQNAAQPPPPPQPAPDDSGTPPAAGLSAMPSDAAAPKPWEALLAAGLGMMAGTSPHAAVNIGRGGLEGLSDLQKQRQLAAQNALRRAQMADTAAYREGVLGVRGQHEDSYAARVSQLGSQIEGTQTYRDRVLQLRSQGMDDHNAQQQAKLDLLREGLGIRAQQGDRRLDQGDVRLAQGADRINQAATRLQQTDDYHKQSLGLKQSGMADANIRTVMNNASRRVAMDLTGKLTLEKAVADEMRNWPGGAPSPRPAPAAPPAAAPAATAAPHAAAAQPWRYSATGPNGLKALSNDGQHWFKQDGSPIEAPGS